MDAKQFYTVEKTNYQSAKIMEKWFYLYQKNKHEKSAKKLKGLKQNEHINFERESQTYELEKIITMKTGVKD